MFSAVVRIKCSLHRKFATFVLRWHRNRMPLPITDDTFGDMESIKKVIFYVTVCAYKISYR